MPDGYTGYYDESRLRQLYLGDQVTPVQPNETYNGRWGVLYGEGPKLTDDQALAYIQRQNQGAWARGALPVDHWQRYHPNATADDLKAYQRLVKAYGQNTSGTGGVGNSLGNAAEFELSHVGDILEGATDYTRIFGFDPITTELGNAVFGTNNKPLVNQMGGATRDQIRDYEAKHGTNSAGASQNLHDAAAGVTAVVTAGTLANGGLTGGGAAPAGGGPTTVYRAPGNFNYAASGDALPEIVVTGTRQGLSAAQLAAMGAVGSGAAIEAGGIGGNVATAGGGGNSGAGGMAGTSWMDWAGPLINAGASIIGSDKAGDAVKAGTKEGIAESRRQFDLVRADTAPQRALGAGAVDRIARWYGMNTGEGGGPGAPDSSGFFTSPEYSFNVAEGQKAIDRSAAARLGLLSGAAVKEGERYASGLASRESAAYLDRLFTAAGLGSTGIAASASAGANSANNIAQLAQNAGNSRASIYMNNAANINNSIQQAGSNYLLRRYLEAA